MIIIMIIILLVLILFIAIVIMHPVISCTSFCIDPHVISGGTLCAFNMLLDFVVQALLVCGSRKASFMSIQIVQFIRMTHFPYSFKNGKFLIRESHFSKFILFIYAGRFNLADCSDQLTEIWVENAYNIISALNVICNIHFYTQFQQFQWCSGPYVLYVSVLKSDNAISTKCEFK